MMLHAICEAYGGHPSQRLGIEDPMLALSFDTEVLTKARTWEKAEMDKMREGGDKAGNEAKLKANSKEMFDEWLASLPEGHHLKVKYGAMSG